MVLIVIAVFIDNGLLAKEQSPNSTATIKFKVLSESMKASDIHEIRNFIKAGAELREPFLCMPILREPKT